MPEITFTSQPLPQTWTKLVSHGAFVLGRNNDSGAWPLRIACKDGVWIALLSRTDTPESVIDLYARNSDSFIDALGVSAGIIWEPNAQKLCIFRDKFGFIPILTIFHHDHSITFTTSPEHHTALTKGRGINRAYLGRFLQMIDSDSRDDVFERTERILPGEVCHYHVSVGDLYRLVRRDCYWHRRRYTPFQADQRVLAEGLCEKLVQAASKIPSDRPVFTLSGGLDSSGILAAYCKAHRCHARNMRLDAISLTSQAHASCDESRELDILEQSFPIDLKRVNMDDAWPLSEPRLYTQYRAYGPQVAPGIESTLALYRTIEKHFGPRTVVTGYGGNFIVKVRVEALWRHLICNFYHSSNEFRDLWDEIFALRPRYIRSLAARCLGNVADGRIRQVFKRHSVPFWDRALLFPPEFVAQFPPEYVDPVFAMSHVEERAWLPISWEWEMCARSLDMIARECPHAFYDPLFDPDVYDYCAQIPPQYFLKCRDYRTIYKDALSHLLPAKIIAHPKVQSFDDLMLDGLRCYAKEYILQNIANSPYWVHKIINTNALSTQFNHFCELSTNRTKIPYPISEIWRSLSTCIWSVGDTSMP